MATKTATCAAAIAAIAAVVLTAVSLRELSPSELRYAEAGREMLETGDWIVPHLGYVSYFEKPILFYWCEAAAQALLGGSALAARLPSIVAAVAMVATTFALGRSLRGTTCAAVAASLLLAAPAFQVMSTAAMTDAVFAAWLVLAWYAFRRHDLRPGSAWIWAFWTALGFAVLTKGPLGPALVGTTVLTHLALSRRLREVSLLRPVRGVLVVLAINAPWNLLVWSRDPRFLEFFYVRENLRAFVDSGVNHDKAAWYYPAFLLVGFLPFTVAVAAGLWADVRHAWADARRSIREPVAAGTPDGRTASPTLYLSAMIWPPLALLCVAGSKLGTYLLPLLPAIALSAGVLLEDTLERASRWMRWSAPATVGTIAAAGIAARFVLDGNAAAAQIFAEHGTSVGVAVALLLAATACAAFLVARGKVRAGWIAAACGMTAALLAQLPVSDALTRRVDARDLVAQLLHVREPGSRVVLAGACAQDYTVVHELHARVEIWGPARELGMGHFTEVTSASEPVPDDPHDVAAANLPANPWLLDDPRLAAAWRGPDRVWLIGRPEDVETLRRSQLGVVEVAANAKRALATNHPLPNGR